MSALDVGLEDGEDGPCEEEGEPVEDPPDSQQCAVRERKDRRGDVDGDQGDDAGRDEEGDKGCRDDVERRPPYDNVAP